MKKLVIIINKIYAIKHETKVLTGLLVSIVAGVITALLNYYYTG